MPLYKLVRPLFTADGAFIQKGAEMHFAEGKQPKGSKLLDTPKPQSMPAAKVEKKADSK